MILGVILVTKAKEHDKEQGSGEGVYEPINQGYLPPSQVVQYDGRSYGQGSPRVQ